MADAAGKRPAPAVAGGRMPPGSRWPRAVQIMLFMSARTYVLPRWQRRFGNVFTLDIAPGGGKAVVLADPEDIHSVFRGSPRVFHAGEGNAVLAPVMGAGSIFLLDEEAHRISRRALATALHGDSANTWRHTIATVSSAAVESWPQHTPFRALTKLNDISIAVILRIVFGVSDERRMQQLQHDLARLVRIGPVLYLGWLRPGLQRFGPWRRYARLQSAVDAAIHAEVTERRAAPDLAARIDVLSRLLLNDPQLTDTQLRDHLITLLLAGHETTAATLAWTLHDLVREPEAYARARHAADNDEDDYLDAVIKEAMRLRPAISSVARRLTERATVAGWELPAGVTIFACIRLAHRSVDDDQHRFRPERFLHPGSLPAGWLPFGGGARRCPGATLAVTESVTVLKTVLRLVDLSPVGRREIELSRNVTTVPGRGTRLIARHRTRPAPTANRA